MTNSKLGAAHLMRLSLLIEHRAEANDRIFLSQDYLILEEEFVNQFSRVLVLPRIAFDDALPTASMRFNYLNTRKSALLLRKTKYL